MWENGDESEPFNPSLQGWCYDQFKNTSNFASSLHLYVFKTGNGKKNIVQRLYCVPSPMPSLSLSAPTVQLRRLIKTYLTRQPGYLSLHPRNIYKHIDRMGTDHTLVKTAAIQNGGKKTLCI